MVEIPFADHCRIETVEVAGAAPDLSVAVGPPLTNSRGQAHGGLIMTLLDISMGRAVVAAARDATTFATLELSVCFIRPGEGRLRAVPEVLRAGGTVAFASCEIRDGADRLVAKGTGVFKLIRD